MSDARSIRQRPRLHDWTAGATVCLVTLPLLVGISSAASAPVVSGLIAGILGGLIVGGLGRSDTSISGPSAGLIAVVASQIVQLGSFETVLLAVLLAGLMQIAVGALRFGFLAAFFPSSVINGLLAAIGVILVLKQVPHVLGHDTDPEGEMSFLQPDRETTFSEFGEMLYDMHPGAVVVGLASLMLLFAWRRLPLVRRDPGSAFLATILVGIALNFGLSLIGGPWGIQPTHRVQVPTFDSVDSLRSALHFPNWSQALNPAVYSAAVLIAVIASLESLLNLDAIDKLDPQQRTSPPNRELLAQGTANVVAGLIGGFPITADVVRSAVNVRSGAQTRWAAMVFGGGILVGCLLLPRVLNQIPLSCLAAVLLAVGVQLADPQRFLTMWRQGRYQFAPFIATVLAIVFTDLVTGVLIGLAVSVGFILNSNFRRPLRRYVERQLGGDVVHIELANQVSFLNRGVLSEALDRIPRNGQVLLDARQTDYIDPDVLDLIREYEEHTAPARNIKVSRLGFRSKYHLDDRIEYVESPTRALQGQFTPADVLGILRDGHERFRTGRRLTRQFDRQVSATSEGQHPLAVVLSCIDSRTPAEILFDQGVGDIFSVRIAGNTISPKVLGSIEYGCAVAGAKLVLVMGHTRCGAVTTAVRAACTTESMAQLTGCQHVEHILQDIRESIDETMCRRIDDWPPEEQQQYIDLVARDNVVRIVHQIPLQSETLALLVRSGRIAIVGALYDVGSGTFTYWIGADAVASSSREPAEIITAV